MPWIKAIYQAANADQALVRLEEFEAEWGDRYPRSAKPRAGLGST
jgi:putative transposase